MSPVRSRSVPTQNRSGTPSSENRSRSSSPSQKLLSGNALLLPYIGSVLIYFSPCPEVKMLKDWLCGVTVRTLDLAIKRLLVQLLFGSLSSCY